MLVSRADTFRRNPRLNACFFGLGKQAGHKRTNQQDLRKARAISIALFFCFHETCKRILNENLINFIEQSCYNEHER